MVLITIVNGVYKPTNITGGPHIVWELQSKTKGSEWFPPCQGQQGRGGEGQLTENHVLKSTKNTTLTWYLGISSSKCKIPHLSVDDFPIKPSIYSLCFFHNTHKLPKKTCKKIRQVFFTSLSSCSNNCSSISPKNISQLKSRTSDSCLRSSGHENLGVSMFRTPKIRGNSAMWGPRFR